MSAAVKNAITNVLQQRLGTEGSRSFLLRLRDDPENRIDRIWRGYAELSLEDAEAELRSLLWKARHLISEGLSVSAVRRGLNRIEGQMVALQGLNVKACCVFVQRLSVIWECSERSLELAELRAEIRTLDKSVTAFGKLVAKVVADESIQPQVKAAVLKRASTTFEHAVAEWNFASILEPWGDIGPLLDIRSDHNGSRQRTAFMRVAAHFFYNSAGEWHDGWVADLTDVAFPDEEATSIDMVRSARRSVHP
jgi:hypothetical protein